MHIEKIPNGELVSLLFLKDTFESVKSLFISNSDRSPLDTDWPVRLQKANTKRINLQLIVDTEPVIKFIPGEGKTSNFYRFSKVIGSFELHSKQIKVRVPLAFRDTAKIIIENQLNEVNIPILDFDFLEDALIGAFSVEAFNYFLRYEDIKGIYLNMIKMDMYMTFDGEYPQCFLDDKYGISLPLSGYSKERMVFMHLVPYIEKVKELYSEGILDKSI